MLTVSGPVCNHPSDGYETATEDMVDWSIDEITPNNHNGVTTPTDIAPQLQEQSDSKSTINPQTNTSTQQSTKAFVQELLMRNHELIKQRDEAKKVAEGHAIKAKALMEENQRLRERVQQLEGSVYQGRNVRIYDLDY